MKAQTSHVFSFFSLDSTDYHPGGWIKRHTRHTALFLIVFAAASIGAITLSLALNKPEPTSQLADSMGTKSFGCNSQLDAEDKAYEVRGGIRYPVGVDGERERLGCDWAGGSTATETAIAASFADSGLVVVRRYGVGDDPWERLVTSVQRKAKVFFEAKHAELASLADESISDQKAEIANLRRATKKCKAHLQRAPRGSGTHERLSARCPRLQSAHRELVALNRKTRRQIHDAKVGLRATELSLAGLAAGFATAESANAGCDGAARSAGVFMSDSGKRGGEICVRAGRWLLIGRSEIKRSVTKTAVFDLAKRPSRLKSEDAAARTIIRWSRTWMG